MITSMKIAYIYDAIYPYIKILPCLKKDISPFLSGLFGAILGGSFFLLLFDFSLLNPLNIEWLMGDQGDITQSFLGWHFFRNSEWTFPLGKILQYNFPQGTSIGFTDSIPFLALLFKTMNPLTFCQISPFNSASKMSKHILIYMKTFCRIKSASTLCLSNYFVSKRSTM